jgi:hypothetical protein
LCPGPLEPGLGPLDNHRSLKVREHRQHAEQSAAGWRTRIEPSKGV